MFFFFFHFRSWPNALKLILPFQTLSFKCIVNVIYQTVWPKTVQNEIIRAGGNCHESLSTIRNAFEACTQTKMCECVATFVFVLFDCIDKI